MPIIYKGIPMNNDIPSCPSCNSNEVDEISNNKIIITYSCVNCGNIWFKNIRKQLK